MSRYPLHTIDSAPAGSKPVLEQLRQTFGVIPNIAAAMAASPVLINGFIGLFERVHASSLTEPQIQTLLLDETPIIIPFFYDQLIAMRKGVNGVRFTALAQLYFDRAVLSA